MSLQEISIDVEGMSCSHCSGTVQKALEAIHGLCEIKVDLKGKKALFKTDDLSRIDQAKDAIVKAGFNVVS